MGGGTRLVAALTQALELLLQLAELLDACGDMADVRVQQGIHIGAVLAGSILEVDAVPESRRVSCPACGNGE